MRATSVAPFPIKAILVAMLLLAPLCALRAEALLIDTENSFASFTLRALWVKRIDGEFTRVEGLIEREATAGRFGVDVRVAADSVTMQRPSHATWARSADFFDAQRYPWIRFRALDLPEHLLHEGGDIQGDLTLRGVTLPIRFVLEPAECPRPGFDCTVRAHGEVRRAEFGMNARRLVLSDRVRLDFAIRVHPSMGQGASAPSTE